MISRIVCLFVLYVKMNDPLTAVIASLAGNYASWFHRINRALYGSFGKTDLITDLLGCAAGITDHSFENHVEAITVLLGPGDEQRLYHLVLRLT